MKRVHLIRLSDDGKQTIGKLLIFSDTFRQRYSCYTIEPAWKDNQQNISCIPPGTYEVVKHLSPNFGRTFWLLDVPGRSEILIHVGNFRKNTRGCILVGDELKHIDRDNLLDVSRSARTIGLLWNHLPDNFELVIS